MSRREYIFDQVAALYDEARTHYPDELIEAIISLSGIPAGGRVLEIGCGTGHATRPFAKRGYQMLCLEPGPNLAAIAAREFHDCSNVEIVVTSLEDWELEEESFDLVIVADAFKWLSADVAYQRPAVALKDCGALAIFRNASPPEESGFFRTLDRAYEAHAPELAAEAARGRGGGGEDERAAEIRRTGLFEEPIVRHYAWSIEYDADAYVKLLNTYSGPLSLPEGRRRKLSEAVRELIEQHGGSFRKQYVASLHLARRRRG